MAQTPYENRTALVTGACGGLGRAIAEAFLAAGARVVVCDINPDLIADFTTNVSARHPDRTLVVECDITDDGALDDLFARAEKKFGPLDYVVNSAGMMDRFDPVGDMEKAMWDRVIALNLTAPAMVTKRAVNSMMKSGVKGSIVNIASIAGTRGYTCGPAYTASKHGLLGLTKNTAAFYGPKAAIRCNAIMPGYMQTNIATAFMNGINVEGLEVMKKNFPDGAMPVVDTAKVAKLVLFLCSDAADIVNGACWTADGGATAN